MALTLLLASGITYFLGGGLILLAAVLPVKTSNMGWRLMPAILACLGVPGVVLSATPTPAWLNVVWAAAFVAWVVACLVRQTTAKAHMRLSQGALAFVTIVAVALEVPHAWVPRVPTTPSRMLYVIGDSLSAGLGQPEEKPWPQVLAQTRQIRVINLAEAGATVRSARHQAGHIGPEPATVLLEIGGNDLIAGRPAGVFELELDELISSVTRPGRTVVMLELPLPALCNGYGAAQRRVAAARGVILFPKRLLARVLADPAATTDGLHLSVRGQESMADMIWDVLAASFREATSQPGGS